MAGKDTCVSNHSSREFMEKFSDSLPEEQVGFSGCCQTSQSRTYLKREIKTKTMYFL